MNTKHARPFWQRCLSAITAMVMVLGLFPLAALGAPFPPERAELLAEPGLLAPHGPLAPAATQTLGGQTFDGNLKIDVYDDGSIGLFRYDSANVGDEWATLVYNGVDVDSAENPNKNSRLQYTGGGYYFGWPDGMASNPTDAQVTSVSNTKVGDTVVSVFTAGSTRITQTVSYSNGDDFIRYDWAIQNTGGSALSNLRFFHGMDTCLGLQGYYCDTASDTGAGLWLPAARAVGVRNVSGSEEIRFYLQGVTPPENYDSLEYCKIWTNMAAGALTDALNTDPATDNGYALEWRQASLDAGGVWTITAYERFSVAAFDSVFVVAPPLTEIEQGASGDLIYTLTNDNATGVDVDLSVSKDQPTWTATLQGAATVNVPGSSSITVTVQVDVPAGASIGATGYITLTADSDGAPPDSSDKAMVLVTAGSTPPPDVLELQKVAIDLNGGGLYAGDTIEYRLMVRNITDTLQTNVVITDMIPMYTTYVPGSAWVTQGSVSGPDPLVANIGDLAADEYAVLTFRVTVNAGAAGQDIDNIASAGSDQQDPPVDVGPIKPQPDPGPVKPGDQLLEIQKTAQDLNGSPLYVSDEIEYQVMVRNITTTAQTNIVITDAIPAHTTYVPGSASVTQGSVDDSGPIVADIGTLNAGEYAVLTFRVTVNADAAGQDITNQASATSDEQSDPVYTEPTPPYPGPYDFPDPGPEPVKPGDVTPPSVTHPVSGTLINDATPTFTGTADAGALITVTLQPTGTVLCTAVADGNGDWTCTPTTPLPEGEAEIHVVAGDDEGNESGSGDIEETLTTFPANSVLTYTVSASGGTNEIVWNTVTITPPATMFDVIQENNIASRPTVYRLILPVVYKNASP